MVLLNSDFVFVLGVWELKVIVFIKMVIFDGKFLVSFFNFRAVVFIKLG